MATSNGNTQVWDQLVAKIGQLGSMRVHVGVLQSKAGAHPSGIDMVELAAIHEFGAPAAHIPARSFIRSTFMVRRVQALASTLTKLAGLIVNKGMANRTALSILGQWGAAECKNTITEIDISPPLAQSTIDAKGSDKPLVDTGRLVDAISYEVVE